MPTASGGLRGGNYATAYRTAYAPPSSSYGRSSSASRSTQGHPGQGCASQNNATPHYKAPRPLPAGPGPLDKHGKKLEGFSLGLDSRGRHSHAAGGHSTSVRSGPLKADHSAGITISRHPAQNRASNLTKKQSRSSLDPLPPSTTIGSGLSARRSSSLASLRISDESSPSVHTSCRYDSDDKISQRSSSRRGSRGVDDGIVTTGSSAHARQTSGGEAGSKRSGGGGGSHITSRVPRDSSPGTSSGNAMGLRGNQYAAPHQVSSTSKVSSHSSTSSSSANEKGRDREGGKVGLRNLGNTCFMNSVLQCLSNTRPLLEWCLSEGYLADINTSTSSMKGSLIKAFANLMKGLWKENSTESYVSPNAFKTQIQKFAPRFMGYSQQDSQEFLRYLLEGIHEDVNRIKVKPKPISLDDNRLDKKNDRDKAKDYWNAYLTRDSSHIVDIFVGQLKSELKFEDCGHRSVTFDPFWDLSLSIPKSGSDQSLDNCLRLFMKEEELEAEERPMCTKCKLRRSCTKSFSIQRFPQILVFHLKRFSQERYGRKLTSLVDFPVKDLDLSDYSSEGGQKVTYDLYAVSNHSGGVHSGHYTAMCKNPHSGEWHTFNDTRVSGARCNQAVSSEAYLLFYELTSPPRRS